MSLRLLVRTITAEDVARCATLMNQLGYAMDEATLSQRVRAVQECPGHAIMVAIADHDVVGVLHVFHRPALEKPEEAVVQSLVVDEGRRGSGIGRCLMNAAESWALQRDLMFVSLSSHERRQDAHAFYNALGYETSGCSTIFRKVLRPT